MRRASPAEWADSHDRGPHFIAIQCILLFTSLSDSGSYITFLFSEWRVCMILSLPLFALFQT